MKKLECLIVGLTVLVCGAGAAFGESEVDFEVTYISFAVAHSIEKIAELGTAGKFIGEFCEKVAEAEKQSGYRLNGLGFWRLRAKTYKKW